MIETDEAKESNTTHDKLDGIQERVDTIGASLASYFEGQTAFNRPAATANNELLKLVTTISTEVTTLQQKTDQTHRFLEMLVKQQQEILGGVSEIRRPSAPAVEEPAPTHAEEVERLRKENEELRTALAKAQDESNELHEKLQLATQLFIQRKPKE
jgi:type II secretory pathway component PulM